MQNGLDFRPSDRFEGGSVKFDIGTAGSIPLTLMTVIPAVSFSNNNLHIEITGGQTSKQAQQSIISSTLLQKHLSIGSKFSVDVLKRGYYPNGGGIVQSTINPCRSPDTIEFLASRYLEPKIMSVCSKASRGCCKATDIFLPDRLGKKGYPMQ